MGDTAAKKKEPKPKDGAKAAKPAEKKDVKKTIEKKDAKDGKAKEEKPKAKIDDKSKAKADKPKPKDEKSKAKADEKPKIKAKVDDKPKPKTEDTSKAKADEKSKPKTDEKSKAKDSKAKKAPAAAAAAEASERKAAAATAAATAAGKKRKKDEIEETAPEPEEEEEDDDTRKLQEGVVEEPGEAKAKPRGACAAEALDAESEDHGPPQKAAKNSGKPGQVDRSQSHDPGEESQPEEAEDGQEKPKEKGKAKDKTKEKGKDKERGRGKKKKDKTSYSYEEDSRSSDASAARRKKRRANAGLKPASGFGLAPPPAAEAPMSAFSSAPSAPMAVLPAPVAGLLTSDVATDLQRMRMAVEAATGKTMEPRLKLDQREEEREQKLSMAEDLRDALLDPSNMKQLLTRTSLLSVTQAEDGKIVLRAPSKQSMKDAMSVLARVAHHCAWGCNLTKVGLLLREKPEKAIHTVVIRLAATSSRMQTQEGRVNPRSDKLRIGTDARQCQVVVEAIAGISRKHATISFEQDKGACYIQDMSTNGTRLNGKRLPRPPYKHPMDARVRIFHGDELVLSLTPEGEELGYVINLHELSG